MNFTLVFLGIVFQFTVLGIACDTGLCRYDRHDQYCYNSSERLIDLRISKEKHHDHKCCDRQQDPDHRIAEGFFELIPERGRFGIRNLIGAKPASGLLYLFVCQSIILHLFVSCFIFEIFLPFHRYCHHVFPGRSRQISIRHYSGRSPQRSWQSYQNSLLTDHTSEFPDCFLRPPDG